MWVFLKNDLMYLYFECQIKKKNGLDISQKPYLISFFLLWIINAEKVNILLMYSVKKGVLKKVVSVFSFGRGSNSQNHSLGSHHPVKNSRAAKFLNSPRSLLLFGKPCNNISMLLVILFIINTFTCITVLSFLKRYFLENYLT